jgi:hypothetical protein
MATNSSNTPSEGQKEKPKQGSRFIIAMVPVKKSRYHHHPRSDAGNGYPRKRGRPARATDLPSTFFGTLMARRGGFFGIGGRFRRGLIDFVL